jgi:ubiquitin C-terminal hydrolase
LFNAQNNNVAPKEFIFFVISQLHKELNKKKNIDKNNSYENQEQANELAMFKLFKEKFQNENMSIISDLFYGCFHISIKCSNFHDIKHNFEIFPYLIFDLEAVKQNKIDNWINIGQQMNNPQMQLNYECLKNMNSVTIYDCFDYFQKRRILQDNDAIPCNICINSPNESYYQTIIYSPPEILIIILDRNQYSEIQLEFLEDLNLSNYIEEKNLGTTFKLISVVKVENGNFVACCKYLNLNEQQWYRCDDNSISKISNFKNQIVHSGLVHILFYQKCD